MCAQEDKGIINIHRHQEPMRLEEIGGILPQIAKSLMRKSPCLTFDFVGRFSIPAEILQCLLALGRLSAEIQLRYKEKNTTMKWAVSYPVLKNTISRNCFH